MRLTLKSTTRFLGACAFGLVAIGSGILGSNLYGQGEFQPQFPVAKQVPAVEQFSLGKQFPVQPPVALQFPVVQKQEAVSKANPRSVSTDNWIRVDMDGAQATSSKNIHEVGVAPAYGSNLPGDRSVSLIPNAIRTGESAQQTGYAQPQELDFSNVALPELRVGPPVSNMQEVELVMPVPLGHNAGPYQGSARRKIEAQNAPASKMSVPGYNGWNPEAGRDEYVFDGSDRAVRVQVDPSWNVSGLDTEDTVGHFDTLDGRRIVTPSNRVAIYAPRFAAVRRVDGIFKANLNLPIRGFKEQIPIAQSGGTHDPTTTKQHLALDRFAGTKRASQFLDETRGVVSDSVTHLFGIRNTFEAYENLSLIRYGKFSSGETARLSLGLQSAAVWEDDLGLQVVVDKASPVIAQDVESLRQLVSVESEDGTAILRVTKVASKIAARTGEFVEFTIRFDNMSPKRIGNVTIIDNLTRRLEYVDSSAECSVKAGFINKRNQADSLMLRWEITDPIEPHEGGVIRFKCRVR